MAIAYDSVKYYQDETGAYYVDEEGNRYTVTINVESLELTSAICKTLSLSSPIELELQ